MEGHNKDHKNLPNVQNPIHLGRQAYLYKIEASFTTRGPRHILKTLKTHYLSRFSVDHGSASVHIIQIRSEMLYKTNQTDDAK